MAAISSVCTGVLSWEINSIPLLIHRHINNDDFRNAAINTKDTLLLICFSHSKMIRLNLTLMEWTLVESNLAKVGPNRLFKGWFYSEHFAVQVSLLSKQQTCQPEQWEIKKVKLWMNEHWGTEMRDSSFGDWFISFCLLFSKHFAKNWNTWTQNSQVIKRKDSQNPPTLLVNEDHKGKNRVQI